MSHTDHTQANKRTLEQSIETRAFGAANFLARSKSAMMRGGRVTKFKGIAASCAPQLGIVTDVPGAVAGGGRGSTTLSLARRLLRWSAAPVALLAAQSPAFAQAQDECVQVSPGNFVCEDNGDPATSEQDLSIGDVDVTVQIQDGFEVDTSDGGENGDGINIQGAQNVVIEQQSGSSAITGDGYGIDVYSATGDISITTGGDVTGISNAGIYAETDGDEAAIDSRAGAVSGGSNGIDARVYGSGALNVTTADVTASGGYGIYVNGSGSAVVIDSTAGAVTGSVSGIYAKNQGTGDLSITTAVVTGTNGDGIYANNYDGSDALIIDSTAGAVTGSNDGINARNEGSGDTSITTSDVTGTTGNGIYARSGGVFGSLPIDSGDLSIDTSAGAVSGGDDGIDASVNGGGNLSITTANVTGSSDDGISARLTNTDGDSTIDTTAGVVTGGSDGIDLLNDGDGDSFVITGDVIGITGNGI
ncbi:MAG: hypothetical protein WBA51_17675, partial [Erythrobacter sp.]